MADDRTPEWLGYAPATIRAHKYAVRYHPKLGRRVACVIPERERDAEVTLFSRVPHPDIEARIPDGGPFFVNEWKQVLKPVLGEEGFRQVLYLGEFPDLHFRFSFRGRVFDNASIKGLRPGDEWKHQEVGMRYKYDLSVGTISRETISWEDFAAVYKTETLESPAPSLLSALARARPGHRAGRFYVNEHGLAFLPRTEGTQMPVFVGRADVESDPWFEKHDPDAPRG